MQRSSSRDHLPSNAYLTNNTVPSPETSTYPSDINNATSFVPPSPFPAQPSALYSRRQQQRQQQDQNMTKKWQILLAISAIFANGIAAASVLYIWKFCNC
jgi:hypothetical protein